MTVPTTVHTADNAVFATEGLEKTFTVGGFFGSRRVPAVKGVDLTIGPREVLGLVGESGSGKSTVARLVAKLYAPSGGQMRLQGQSVPATLRGRPLRNYRKRVQMIHRTRPTYANSMH